MALYDKYLFVQTPNSPDPGGVTPAVVQNQVVASLRDFADITEMYARRRMLYDFAAGTDLAKTSLSKLKADSDKMVRCSRFFNWNVDRPRISAILPGALSGGKFDAADYASDMESRNYNTNLFNRLSTLYPVPGTSPGSSFLERLIYVLPHDLMDGTCCFLDPDWVHDPDWGASAEGTATWKEDFFGTTTTGPSTTATRFTVPEAPYFHAVTDAVYARELRSEPYTFTDAHGNSVTRTLNIPPYMSWYNPRGTACYHTLTGASTPMRTWGKYAGSAFPYHAIDAFKFEYGAADPTRGADYATSHVDRPDPDECLASGDYILPPLNTESSWWEDNRLGVATGESSGRASGLIPAGRCRDEVRSFYIAPNLTPRVLADENGFPPGANWRAVEGNWGALSYYWFDSPFPFAGTMRHAYEFMKKLHKVCIKVDYLRVWFSSASTRTDTTAGVSSTETEDTCAGWTETDAVGSTPTDLDSGGLFRGFGLDTDAVAEGKGSGSVSRIAETKRGSTTAGTTTTEHSDELEASFSISKMIPLAKKQSCYDYATRSKSSIETPPGSTPVTYDSGNVPYSSNSSLDPVPLIPDWAMPFVKTAELVLVCEGTLRSFDTATGTVSADYSSSPAAYGGSLSRTNFVKRARRAVSLGTLTGPASKLEFSGLTLDLHALMDDVIPSEDGMAMSCSVGESGVDIGQPTIYNGSVSCTYVYDQDNPQTLKSRSATYEGDTLVVDKRSLDKVSLFLIVDFDPDIRDMDPPWANAPDESTPNESTPAQ